MYKYVRTLVLATLMIGPALSACNLPSGTAAANAAATMVAATLSALQTNSASQAALPSPTSMSAPPPPPTTNLPESTPTPQNPLIIQLALCWTGPGNVYPVVSSVRVGTRVELMGVGSIPGWYIIRNPTYHDPCWIEAKYLQIDPGYDLSGLKIFNPPPTPGPTETPEPTDTP